MTLGININYGTIVDTTGRRTKEIARDLVDVADLKHTVERGRCSRVMNSLVDTFDSFC